MRRKKVLVVGRSRDLRWLGGAPKSIEFIPLAWDPVPALDSALSVPPASSIDWALAVGKSRESSLTRFRHQVFRSLKTVRPDAIHVFGALQLGSALADLPESAGKKRKFILTPHPEELGSIVGVPGLARALRRCLRAADLVTVASRDEVERVRSLGVAASRTRVLHFLDLKGPTEWAGLSLRQVVKRKAGSIQVVCQEEEFDRSFVILSALRGSSQRARRCSLWFDRAESDPSLVWGPRRMARQAALRAEFDLCDLVRSRIVVSAEVSGGYSSWLPLAMSAGAVPICPHSPANARWIEHGVNGFLVDPEMPLQIAECLDAAIHGELEPALDPNRDLARIELDPARSVLDWASLYEER